MPQKRTANGKSSRWMRKSVVSVFVWGGRESGTLLILSLWIRAEKDGGRINYIGPIAHTESAGNLP